MADVVTPVAVQGHGVEHPAPDLRNGAPAIPAYTAEWTSGLVQKDARAEAFLQGRSSVGPNGDVHVAASCPPGDPCGYPSSASLVANQMPQQTSYWCGPAAVSESLGQRSLNETQATTATRLRTDSSGTAWNGIYVSGAPSTGRPVEDILNQRLGSQGARYYQVAVATSATGTDIATYKNRLVADIATGWPLVGNAEEWAGPQYPHLVGHPTDRAIFHWFNIRGYSASGANTMYEDSVHGASSISWSGSVPAYSTLASDTIARVVGGRGYVW